MPYRSEESIIIIMAEFRCHELCFLPFLYPIVVFIKYMDKCRNMDHKIKRVKQALSLEVNVNGKKYVPIHNHFKCKSLKYSNQKT